MPPSDPYHDYQGHIPEHQRLGVTPVEHSSVRRGLPQQPSKVNRRSPSALDVDEDLVWQAEHSSSVGNRSQLPISFDDIEIPTGSKPLPPQVLTQEPSVMSTDLSDVSVGSYVVFVENCVVFHSTSITTVESFVEDFMRSSDDDLRLDDVVVLQKKNLKIGALISE